MVFVAKYESGKDIDSVLPKMIHSIREQRILKNDDYTLFVCGARGTGKSMLGLHASELYMGDKANVEFIGLNPSDFARALKKATESEKPRFCNNDEANISKRDFQNKWNKDLLDTYYSIRGLNIFHIWNNPSLDIIDKKFVEDIVNGVIYIFTKDVTRPRLYYFFTKQSILQIMEKEECLSLKVLKKHAKKKALFRGWFKDYNGILKQPYLEKKNRRMEEKVATFFDKYVNEQDREEDTENYLSVNSISKKIKVSKGTAENYIKILIEKNKLIKEDVIIEEGIRKYSRRLIDILKNLKIEKKQNCFKNINYETPKIPILV